MRRTEDTVKLLAVQCWHDDTVRNYRPLFMPLYNINDVITFPPCKLCHQPLQFVLIWHRSPPFTQFAHACVWMSGFKRGSANRAAIAQFIVSSEFDTAYRVQLDQRIFIPLKKDDSFSRIALPQDLYAMFKNCAHVAHHICHTALLTQRTLLRWNEMHRQNYVQ